MTLNYESLATATRAIYVRKQVVTSANEKMLLLLRRLPQFSSRGIKTYAPEAILNESHMSETIARLKQARLVMPETQRSKRKAAVLIPICVTDGEISLLYTLRTSHLSSHKGQVSFPGGMEDPEDSSLEETALRETEEELGIRPSDVVIWGTGNLISARGNTIMPVIGQIKGDFRLDRISVNPREVQEAFTVSLRDLCDQSKNGYTQFRNGYSLPVYLGGRRRIWGITATITYIFLKALLPGQEFGQRVKFIPEAFYRK